MPSAITQKQFSTTSTHNESHTSKFTVNLSTYTLTESDTELLNKGLTFIPSYRFQPLDAIYKLQHRLVRNLKLKDYYQAQDSDEEEFDYSQPTFRHPSTWIPKDSKISKETLDTIQSVVNSTEQILAQHSIINNTSARLKNFKNNITSAERESINALKSNPDIVIKSADKGSAVVVMNKTDYLREGYRQLLNAKYYRKLDKPILPDTVPKINAILQDMHNRKYIDDKQLTYLSASTNDRGRRFYLLPKIHKPKEKWPFPNFPDCRPIVSDTGSESCRVASYIDHFVRPVAIKHPAYLKDTYDFVNKVRGFRFPKGALLVTADITSLYTNMTIPRMVECVRQLFKENPCPGRPDNHILELLELTLNSNDFTFNGDLFLQICGTAMGKSYAPGLADAYLQLFDEKARTGFNISPIIFLRYIDDVFMIWTGTVSELMKFQDFLNTVIPGITINFEYSPISVNFLDTTVYHIPDPTDPNFCILQTKVYFKATDTHQLLYKSSFHPKHTFNGVLKSQFLRFKRISSSRQDYDEACKIVCMALACRKYSKRQMRQLKADVWRASDAGPGVKAAKPILPIIVPYNEIGTSLAKRWRDSIKVNALFSKFRLITAYTVGRNLSSLLVHSLLLSERTTPTLPAITASVAAEEGCTRCLGPRCLCCRHVIESSTFTSTHNNKSFKVRGQINCKTTNIIYLVTCTKCHQQYVGETSRSLADRLTDHRSCIRLNKTTPLALHFNKHNHSLEDVTIMGIERLRPRDDGVFRRVRETAWKNLLQTCTPLGFNNG